MGVPDRYKKAARWDDRAGVETHEGVDAVTGLPVLIYVFDGDPAADLTELAGENIPRILWSGADSGSGALVVALGAGWRRRGAEDGPLRPAELLAASRALRDAASFGLAHGDLTPARLLLVDDRLQIEGYGVPWVPVEGTFTAPEVKDVATEPGDLWSLAAIVAILGTTVRDDTVTAVLNLCAGATPGDRPSAEEFYLALERLLPDEEETASSASVSSSGTAKPASRTAARTAERSIEPAARPPTEPTTATPATPASEKATEPAAAHPAPAPAPAVENANAPTSAPRSEPPVSAAVPATAGPAGTRAHGPKPPAGSRKVGWAVDEPLVEPGERRRRLAMLAVLMAAVVALALLALYGPRAGRSSLTAGRETTVFVVEVFSAPDDLPPVTIHLVASPPGSSLARGDRLGTAPRHLALDRSGTWAFQGSLGDHRSEVVEIRVPEERSFTLTLPAAAGEP